MSRNRLWASLILAATATLSGSIHSNAQVSPTPSGNAALSHELEFLSENSAAMAKMMAGMDAKPTGDIDVDFTAMMIPHHQGAIDMAVAYLRYGKNEQLRRLAQEIIVEQQQEIAAMHLALGKPPPPSAPAPTQPTTSSHLPVGHDHHSMTSHGGMSTPCNAKQ